MSLGPPAMPSSAPSVLAVHLCAVNNRKSKKCTAGPSVKGERSAVLIVKFSAHKRPIPITFKKRSLSITD
ncbi:unnamed protein product [Strongylus vulgaris]|uniref:Uncharacterized protein n=1 Tax=Strongylus vulgaris TaxID=40348 RepID=A0A3P7KCC5_STRVU|nr:unnamed protein product [Strongylus vulgaris]